MTQEGYKFIMPDGNDLRDFTLFNYADRRNFDTALGLVYSYPFWYTRNIAGWVICQRRVSSK